MLSYVSRIGMAAGANLSSIADLEIRDLGGTAVLYAATRRGGIIQAFSVDAKGVTKAMASVPFEGRDAAGFEAGLAFVGTSTGAAVLYGGGTTGTLYLRQTDAKGALLAPAQIKAGLSGDLVHAMTVELASGAQVVFGGLAGKGGIAGLGFSASGAFQKAAVTPAADVAALASVRLGGKDFLISASADGIATWEIGAGGALTARDSQTAQTGLWIDNVTALETAVLGGRAYVIVAAAGSGSISVLELGAGGKLTLTDHVIDDLSTRFDDVSALELVMHEGAAYVVAGGSDGGISVMRLLPGGRLLGVAHIAGSTDFGLDGIGAIALSSGARGIEIFVTSLRDGGIGHYLFQPPKGAAGVKTGGSGADILMDGAGSDTLIGGAGADVFIFSADGKADTIADFELGTDRIDISAWGMIRSLDQLTIQRSAAGFTIRYGAEYLNVITANRRPVDPAQLVLGDLIDMTHIPPVMPDLPAPAPEPSPGKPVMIGTESGNRMVATALPTRMEGRGGNDTLIGGAGADTIFGGAGNDSLVGGGGNDSIMGDEGNDIIFGGAGRDTMDGGEGNDTIHGGDTSSIFYGGDGDDFLYGGAMNDRIYGGAGNDHIAGSRGNDLLYGGAGNDLIYGASGNDQLYGGDGNDTLYGSLGRDRLFGGLGKDVLYGEDGADRLVGDGGPDRLYGGAGNDAIFGGSGNDIIHGGLGADYLVGGSGADVFVFTSVQDSPPDANRDKILDFSTKGDKIDLSAIDANVLRSGHQRFDYIGHDDFSAAGQLRIFTSGGHTVVQVDIDGDGRTDMNIVLMDTVGVTASDFIL
ncbi:M10 family metallopeptidase C-terminal domain-containing protein [Cereibacter sp. SYSU M97828]|nr:M10 family metallopeptidase C-terminal domain-containing protein [Cereibacter flavus]